MLDVLTPAGPGTLMRAVALAELGVYRLARRDCELYSIQVVSAGPWCRARVMNGKYRVLWYEPSTFPGSWWLGADSEDGLIVEIAGKDTSASLLINWREADRTLK